MYLDIVEHDLEPPANSPYFVNPVCLDFLRLTRDFNDQVFCGTMPPMDDLEPSKLLVEFRSNLQGRYPGFRIHVVCYDPVVQNTTGCTVSGGSPPSISPSVSPTVSSTLNLAGVDSQVCIFLVS